jgi:hypothetical protein
MSKIKMTANIELYSGKKLVISNHVKSKQAFVRDLHAHFPHSKSIKICH